MSDNDLINETRVEVDDTAHKSGQGKMPPRGYAEKQRPLSVDGGATQFGADRMPTNWEPDRHLRSRQVARTVQPRACIQMIPPVLQ